MIVLLGAFPWLAQIFFSYPFKSLLPSDKDTVGIGKLMGFVLSIAPHQDQLGLTVTCLIGLRRKWPRKDFVQTRRNGEICLGHSFVMASPKEKRRLNFFSKCSPVSSSNVR